MIVLPISLDRSFYIAMDVIPLILVIVVSKFPVLFCCCFWNKCLRNFLKNMSRHLFHSQNGPLDRELREDEDLLDSEGKPVDCCVYSPLGLYMIVTPIFSFLWAWRTLFLFETSTCSDNLDCFLKQQSSRIGERVNCSTWDSSDPIICLQLVLNLEQGLVSIGSIAFVYYLLLVALSTILKKLYCCTMMLRCLILPFPLLVEASNFLILYYGVIHSNNLLSELLTYSCFGCSIWLIAWTRWERLYTKKYIKGNKEEEAGFESDNISKNSPTPEDRSSDDGSPEQVGNDSSPEQVEIEMEQISLQDNDECTRQEDFNSTYRENTRNSLEISEVTDI